MQNLSLHTSDEKLLQDLRLDSNEAFEEIFKKYWQVMLTQARAKLQSTEEAEEIVQNIFSTLWEKRHAQEITNLSIYLQFRNREGSELSTINKQSHQLRWTADQLAAAKGKSLTVLSDVVIKESRDQVSVRVVDDVTQVTGFNTIDLGGSS